MQPLRLQGVTSNERRKVWGVQERVKGVVKLWHLWASKIILDVWNLMYEGMKN